MENLNKTQIVLLTLLVSFVTSIATGIVTVTLLDQAPPGVTQTINRVVEKTIQTIMPGENQVTTVVKEVVIREDDFIASAVEKSSKSLADIKAITDSGLEVRLALGFAVSKDGYFVTDKQRIEGNRNNLIVKYGDHLFNASIVSLDDTNFAVLKVTTPYVVNVVVEKEKTDGLATTTNSNKKDEQVIFLPATFIGMSSAKLGQSVLTFGGEGGNTVSVGIISSIRRANSASTNDDVATSSLDLISAFDYFLTDINIDKKNAGGPMVNMKGEVLGINIISDDGSIISVSSSTIKDVILSISNNTDDVNKIENTGKKPQ